MPYISRGTGNGHRTVLRRRFSRQCTRSQQVAENCLSLSTFLRGCVHMEVEVKHGFRPCGPEKAKLEAMATGGCGDCSQKNKSGGDVRRVDDFIRSRQGSVLAVLKKTRCRAPG